MRRRVKVGKEFHLSVSFDEDFHSGKPKSKKSPPRRVAVGTPFEAKIVLSEEQVEAHIRSRIVWVVFTIAAIFLFGSAALGLRKGEFSSLQSIWGVVGPIYGGIATYFFSPRTKRNNESS
jgi:hypothetical protein